MLNAEHYCHQLLLSDCVVELSAAQFLAPERYWPLDVTLSLTYPSAKTDLARVRAEKKWHAEVRQCQAALVSCARLILDRRQALLILEGYRWRLRRE